ncbi:pilus assembly protein [Pseudomonas putida]|uniref:TadE/TadG family type IV pilus assembly protein n=1 Tax=Pseudomonas putida TaxID=303 RepID=UPI0023644C70|nr:TadE/TadG family type IV pilus assembly protein [Pseudomonas putida]MDD2053175.1 pilus assembly protein [Pseudomonas putida]
MQTHLPRKQKGAAAIEFALVFIIFFAVFYGLVSYSLPLLLMQSFNAATAEAVRQSVALDPNTANYNTVIVTRAKAVLTQQLGALPSSVNFNVNTDASATYTSGKLLTVRIDYPKTKLAQIIPLLSLPGIGTVPNLPATLSAQASLQF